MSGNSSGTLNKVTVAGATYEVPMDINLTINYSKYEVEGVATSGDTMYKYTLRIPTVENCVLITKESDATALRKVAEDKSDVSMSLELADGTVLRGTGRINYESWETEENRSTLTLIPNKAKDAWTPFSP